MANIVTVEANSILSASVAGSPTYPAVVTPVNLALNLTGSLGTASAPGVEPTNTGGSTYARVSTAGIWGTASGGSITNSGGTATFTNMPSCSINGIELYDSHTRTTSADATVTSASPNISAADAAFTSADVGQVVTGPGNLTSLNAITIATVTDSTHAVLSANFVGSSVTNATLTIVTPIRRWFGQLTASKTVNAGDTVTFASSSISITLS